MGKIIGVDLGTTGSVACYHDGNESKVLENLEGGRITPSVVAFLDNGERVVGRAAKAQAVINPKRTIASVKRFMGRRHSECGVEEKLVPYSVVGSADELVQIEIDGKRYYPPEISAMVLQDLKKSAEAKLGEPISKAVITVPAYFNDSQRQATIEAGKIAGLEVVRIINEPTAAALAYGMNNRKHQKIAVFDAGGGTFDISILDTGDGVFEVLSTNGDTHLGGDDWDKMLVDHVAEDFKTKNFVDLRKEPAALQRLTEECEKAKCGLSALAQIDISIPYVTVVQGVPKHLKFTLTRALMERICAPLFDRLKGPVQQALADAKLSPSDIGEVVLVGGTTRMLKVQDICRELFNGKEPHKGVNPDEAVAIGAAIQGAILSDNPATRGIVLIDVTPLTLGVETMGGIMTAMIPKNTTIPCKKTECYTTVSDNQPAVDVHILQGERRMVSDNRTLGRFQLAGIAGAPRGIPQVEVTFELDQNGILNVSAKDKATQKIQKVVIQASSGLDKAQIQKMVEEAKQNEELDKSRADLIELSNKADQMSDQVQRVRSEQEQVLSIARRQAVDAAIADVKKALESKNKAILDKAVETLDKAANLMYDDLSKAPAPQQGQAESVPQTPAPVQNTVVSGAYVENKPVAGAQAKPSIPGADNMPPPVKA